MRGRGIYLLPNLFTTGALFAGFYAIVSAIHDQFSAAAIAIFVAMVLDGMDGRIARITNTQSVFGAEYDSLADMVSFGVAPGILAYQWLLHEISKLGFLAAFIYASAAALRLARFNSQASGGDKKYFKGLPSPASAALVAGFIWCGDVYGFRGHVLVVGLTFLITIACGALMVSNIRYYSFKDLDLRGRVPFVMVLMVVLGFGFISLNPPAMFLLILLIYSCSGPVVTLDQMERRRRERKRASRSRDAA
ncbi:MAG: CDP-diacylglycerol--serine O-phosphatidyltransferase [Gammaproteobacteria bacterium]|nr:CDP-diacylglycerol--serine O-phosphatidyltransferase [Gammaproteobacteria bacterium]